MTKEELLEDVLIGGIVKIYTESDETFEGTVTDFGESGLKITLLKLNWELLKVKNFTTKERKLQKKMPKDISKGIYLIKNHFIKF